MGYAIPVRSSRLLLLGAWLVLAAGCVDDNDKPAARLEVTGLRLTTAEDTPISESVVATGQRGHLRVAVVEGPSHGTLTSNDTTLTYSPDANYAGADSAVISVSDDHLTVTATVEVTITPVNDAPDVKVPPPQVTAESVAFVFTGDALVSVTDRDAGSSAIAIELSASAGTITLSGTSGLVFTQGDGTQDATLHFSGSIAEVNAALAGMVVTPPVDFNGLIDLAITASDQGASGDGGAKSDSENFTLGVGAVDTPPFNQMPDAKTVDEDQTLAFTATDAIAIADRDGPDATRVALQVTNGTLTLGTTAGLAFATGDGSGDMTMDFTGPLASVNDALATLTFQPNAEYHGSATLTVTSTTAALSDTDVCAITIAARNDAPVISGPTVINLDPLGIVTFDDAFLYAVADSDAGDALLELAITASTGAFAISGTPAYAVSFPDAQSVLLTGRLVDFAADLDLLQWDPQAAALTTPVTLTLTLNDGGASGGGGPLTDTHTTTIIDGLPTIAVADNFVAQGNVRRLIAAPGVLANDSPAGDLTIVTFDATSTLGGAVNLAADGSFTYDPPLGVGAREPSGVDDSFTYTIANSGGETTVGTVTVKILRVFWFVDKDGAGPTQNGSQLAPFDTIQEAVVAAAGSSPGSTIWVRNAATPYDVAITIPADTIMRGSRVAFPLQTGQVLSGTGTPVLRNSSTTAVRIAANGQATGFDFVPGAITTGPAIAVENVANGIIDHVTIDGFATAIRYANNADVPVVNAVTIRNATARAIQIDTNQFTTMAIFDSLIEDVGNGIEATASPGPTGTGHVLLRVFDVVARRVAGNVLSFQSTSSATAVNELRIDEVDIQNPLAAGVTGSTAIRVIAGGGGLDFEITNTGITGDFARAVDIQAASNPSTQINGRLSQLSVNGGGTAMSAGGIVIGSAVASGDLDVTMDGSTVSATAGAGMRFASNGITACLDLTTSSFGGNDRLELAQGPGSMSLEGFASGTVEDYFAPRGVTELVNESGVFDGAACREPPTF